MGARAHVEFVCTAFTRPVVKKFVTSVEKLSLVMNDDTLILHIVT